MGQMGTHMDRIGPKTAKNGPKYVIAPNNPEQPQKFEFEVQPYILTYLTRHRVICPIHL